MIQSFWFLGNFFPNLLFVLIHSERREREKKQLRHFFPLFALKYGNEDGTRLVIPNHIAGLFVFLKFCSDKFLIICYLKFSLEARSDKKVIKNFTFLIFSDATSFNREQCGSHENKLHLIRSPLILGSFRVFWFIIFLLCILVLSQKKDLNFFEIFIFQNSVSSERRL